LKGKVEFIVRKNRDGETGTAILRLTGWRFSFSEEAETAPYRGDDD
jgi:replicative DNA helicase